MIGLCFLRGWFGKHATVQGLRDDWALWGVVFLLGASMALTAAYRFRLMGCFVGVSGVTLSRGVRKFFLTLGVLSTAIGALIGLPEEGIAVVWSGFSFVFLLGLGAF